MSTTNTEKAYPASILFIPHGGGPLPLLGDPGHTELIDFLSGIGNELTRPEAIVVVSAHWEAARPSLTSAGRPELIYDYYGFPAESYQLSYPAVGKPDLAHALARQLEHEGFEVDLAPARGFDHGLFVPLKLIYPEADIPCIQLSLVNSLDPLTHVRIGEALQPLRDENILVLGSGFSFHNLRALVSDDPGRPDPRNEAFEHWLIDTCTRQDLPEQERRQRLVDWSAAPHADYCHPRSEHLLPLHLCYGLAAGPARLVFEGRVLGKRASAFLW